MKLTFCGGAQSVTGSNYLLESGDTKILIDCGLFQGPDFSEISNYNPFPYEPRSIQAVFITHAHIDHIGRVPQLHNAGFEGRIFSTEPSKDFAEALLLDAEHMMREDAEKKHKKPLYTIDDIVHALKLWEGIPYHRKVIIGPFEVELYDAGHVLGSSSVVVSVEGKRIVFSGDLGNTPTPFIHPTEPIPDVDYALVESTYGDRLHERIAERGELLEDTIEEVERAGGTLMIPAFALERTQELLFELNDLVQGGKIPQIPIYVDSPLAIKLTAVYQKYSTNPMYFTEEAMTHFRKGVAMFNFPGLTMSLTVEQSKAINDVEPPKVIIAGSGMSQGGRIIHHEMRYLSDPRSTILFVGYQAEGSLGRQIVEGVKTVRIMREEVPVRCKIRTISGYSAHADQNQLLKWLEPMRSHVKKVFVVQGEHNSSYALAQRAIDELAIDAEVPEAGSTVVL